MSWHPNDLVSDRDLMNYEANILTQFGQSSWLDRRTKALEDWLWPILKANNLDPTRLRTRFEAEQVWAVTSAVFTDRTTSARDTVEDDLDLAAILATPSTDAIYVGSVSPFRGLHWRILDAVNSNPSVLTVSYWADAWTAFTLKDGTDKAGGTPFSGGGSMIWGLVPDWTIRTINQSDPLYWAKITLSAVPIGAKATQIGVIRRSCLAAPATLRTLMMIFREAPTAMDGPWDKKSAYYEAEADLALERALAIVGGEFDTTDPVTPTDLVSAEDAKQTTEEAAGGRNWTWERG